MVSFIRNGSVIPQCLAYVTGLRNYFMYLLPEKGDANPIYVCFNEFKICSDSLQDKKKIEPQPNNKIYPKTLYFSLLSFFL